MAIADLSDDWVTIGGWGPNARTRLHGLVENPDALNREAPSRPSARPHQPARLSTLVMTENLDRRGIARYPAGILPILDPGPGKTPVDSLRRSFTTSIAYGPSILMACLPHAYCQPGRKLAVDSFSETHPVDVVAVGAAAIHGPEYSRMRS